MMALLVAGSSLLGALVAAVLACVPGLHVYNIMALVVLGAHAAARAGVAVPSECLIPLLVGMTVSWAMINTIPSVLLAAPDESALFTVLPGQKYLMRGRGQEAVLITGAGGLAGLFLLLLGAGPLAPRLVPLAETVLRPHTHWVLWAVIIFLLMSEWPKGGRLSAGGWATFCDGWTSTGAGLLTFLLSGLLGFALLYRSPINPGIAFQNLMPAFVGLFTLPWLLLNLASSVEIPSQSGLESFRLEARRVLLGAFAGGLGGGFAAFFPVVTGGIGGLLAGHATALRDDRVFLASQGASKIVYYVGGFLLFFLPGLHLTRGGSAWMLSGLCAPQSFYEYDMALASIGLAGAASFLLLGPLARVTLSLMARFGYRRLSLSTLGLTLALVAGVTGMTGLLVLAVATGIGLIPVLMGARRMNGLGVILLPMACNMSDVGVPVARWLGLL
ncbi:MAG: tripartite tricarboxylate transporter permease [Lentisphaerae bacterium]|nr:tripartite tricarboxylate transporter permease [Lentisphaerota bacterium]